MIEKTEPVENDPVPKRQKSLTWVLLAGLATIGTYAAVLIPAFNGNDIRPGVGMPVLLWSAIFLTLLWRYRSKNGWVGFALGLILGIFVIFVAGFVGGYIKGQAGASSTNVNNRYL